MKQANKQKQNPETSKQTNKKLASGARPISEILTKIMTSALLLNIMYKVSIKIKLKNVMHHPIPCKHSKNGHQTNFSEKLIPFYLLITQWFSFLHTVFATWIFCILMVRIEHARFATTVKIFSFFLLQIWAKDVIVSKLLFYSHSQSTGVVISGRKDKFDHS